MGEYLELKEKLEIKDYKKGDIIEIKLNNINKIIDMSDIFNGCSSLISLPDIHKWNTINVLKMNHLSCDCTSLKSINGISFWNTKNVTSMCNMFNLYDYIIK